MLFAINYSTQAAVLLKQGMLHIDRFKCPDWPELIAEASRYRLPAVHFNLHTGTKLLTTKKLDETEKIADQTQTPYINLHLEVKTSDFPEIPVNSTDPMHRDLILRQMISQVEIAVRRFGNERVIVENVPFRSGGKTLRPSVDPAIIHKIVTETQCGFLLDIPHARISAHSLGMDEREYILSLPVHHVRELHFTGVHFLDGWLQDHLPALEPDWQTLDWVLEHIRDGSWSRPWMLAFEYSGVGTKFAWRSSAGVIKQQGERLYNLVKEI